MTCNGDCNQGRECNCKCKMTKQTEALRMAIEALIYHTEQTRPIEDTDKAIQACKEALEPTVAELNDAYLRDTHVEGMPKDGDCCTEGCIKCDARKVLAETQEPKPPTILARLPNGATVSNVYEAYEAGLKEGKAETQEPVAWISNVAWISDNEELPLKEDVRIPLYTTPQSREWVGLSNDDLYKILNDNIGSSSYAIAHAISEALRAKNT